MELIGAVIRISLFVATTSLFSIILLAYLRSRSRKMLLIAVGFGVFFLHALITMPELVNENYHLLFDENVHLFFHVIGLIFILLGLK